MISFTSSAIILAMDFGEKNSRYPKDNGRVIRQSLGVGNSGGRYVRITIFLLYMHKKKPDGIPMFRTPLAKL